MTISEHAPFQKPGNQPAVSHYKKGMSVSYALCAEIRSKQQQPRVPFDEDTHNLQFHGLALKLDGADLKVNTNRRDVTLRVRIVREPEE